MVDVALLANVATAGAVVIGIAFGLLQWRQVERRRAEAGAFEAMHALQSPEFIRAFAVIADLPPGLSVADMRKQPGAVEAIEQAGIVIETLAVMVHRGIVDITVVDDVFGGFARMLWEKTRAYCEERRTEGNMPGFGEWVQWLAERLAELGRPEKRLGAHVAYRDWRPP
jgi:hypothetical protein